MLKIASPAERVLSLAPLALALVLALFFRLREVLQVDFPLNDGGMFYIMARDIQAAGYSLPAFTTYNEAAIPFAYPPLSFYVAALLSELPGIALIDVFRFLPLAASLGALVAFWLMARAMLGSALAVAFAVLVFALLPRTSTWLLMGGGVARGMGFLFVLLAIAFAYRMYRDLDRRFAIATAVCAALTVMSHLETAWFGFFSIALLFAFYARSRKALVNSALTVALAALLVSPWFLAVGFEHGLEPFIHAAETGGHSFEAWRAFLRWEFAELPYLNWAAALAIAGSVWAIARGELFLPAWLILIMVLDPRAGPTYATVPLALLAGSAMAFAVHHLWNLDSTAAQRLSSDQSSGLRQPSRFAQYWPRVAAIALVLYMGALATRGALLDNFLLRGIDAETRAGLAGLQAVPEESRFAVMTDIVPAWIDPVTEWFPALTGRRSVATPQGYEWFGQDRLGAQVHRSFELQACARRDAECLERWQEAHGETFTHVYLTATCCFELKESLTASQRFELVTETPGGSVYREVGLED